jgi:predicted ATPase/DNA-binding XRE family transcriptional regulator
VSFGQRLRELRRGMDLTQPRLADLAGCSVEMLRKVEADSRKPSAQLATRLAEALELAPPARADFIRMARGLPTRSLPASSLPSPLTRLIGRERELAALKDLLADPSIRLITLLGPPGIGKTRLAVQVATDVDATFRDGVVYVPLAPVRHATRVVESLLEAVGARGASPEDALIERLRARELLLVLDNFEQVVAAGASIGRVLAAAPRLRVIATSRQPLGIYGEHRFDVPPLAVGELRGSPAEALFLERARAVRRGYARTSTELATVTELCRHLGGLPLAIELAAPRARTATPAGLLAQLARSLDLTSGGPVDYAPRQRSMRGALDWSYALLSDSERRVFAALSTFAGGCTLDAAASVVGANEATEAMLEALADKSLLQVTEVAERGRFTMLEIVRQYAAERLAADFGDLSLAAPHADYYATLAEQARPELIGPRQLEWLEHVGADHDNLRAALEWALAEQQAELAGRLAGALWRFWLERGFFHEGRRWLAAALALRNGMSGRVRAAVLTGSGVLALFQSDYSEATEMLVQARDLSADLGDTAALAQALSYLGIVAHDTGDMERAEALFENSLSLRRALGDEWGEATALLNLGMIELDRGATSGARSRFDASAELFRRTGDMRGLAQALSNLGWATQGLHEFASAVRYLEESLELARPLGAARLVANTLNTLALIAWYTRDYPRASELFKQSLAAFAKLGDKRGLAESLEGLGGVAGTQNRPREAALLLGCAGALREAVRAPLLASDLARHATAVETARAQLADTEWERAWAEGRAATADELVVRILDGQLGG